MLDGTTFMTADIASAAVAYYAHEITWDLYGLPPVDLEAITVAVKAVTYLTISVARSFAIAYAFFGDPAAAATFAIAGAFADTVFYVANEYAWDYLGPRPVGTRGAERPRSIPARIRRPAE